MNEVPEDELEGWSMSYYWMKKSKISKTGAICCLFLKKKRGGDKNLMCDIYEYIGI